MKIFKLSEEYSVVCQWEKTRYGFRHLASLMKDGYQVCKAKCCYYNRTWESYEYQSVLKAVIEKYFKGPEKEGFLGYADEYLDSDKGHLKAVAAVCAIGDLLCKTQEEKNAWNRRMLGTVPGLEFPEDFDKLPEEEKKRRLEGALEFIKPKKSKGGE